MNLRSVVCSVVPPLRVACNRNFLWLLTAIAGICARPDLLAVSSIVRALGLAAQCYDRLLDCFRLLKRLNETVEQKPVKAPVPESDAIFVMFVKGVHGTLLRGQIPGA